jgi:hypothetical protein
MFKKKKIGNLDFQIFFGSYAMYLLKFGSKIRKNFPEGYEMSSKETLKNDPADTSIQAVVYILDSIPLHHREITAATI